MKEATYSKQKQHPKEYGIRNYLNKHNIYKGNYDMQTIIINSFCVESGVSNDEGWAYKINFCVSNFGKYAQYAQNNWN